MGKSSSLICNGRLIAGCPVALNAGRNDSSGDQVLKTSDRSLAPTGRKRRGVRESTQSRRQQHVVLRKEPAHCAGQRVRHVKRIHQLDGSHRSPIVERCQRRPSSVSALASRPIAAECIDGVSVITDQTSVIACKKGSQSKTGEASSTWCPRAPACGRSLRLQR